jgi:3-hydroxyisobutyrate dehydrogenase-like beta-hydroxyacid dehydrogenase
MSEPQTTPQPDGTEHDDRPAIGFVGLGNMGRPMATNLLAAGYALTVTDLRREAASELEALGAAWAETPRAVAHASTVTFTALPGPDEVRAAYAGPDGLLAGAGPGSIAIDVSTSTPATLIDLAADAASRGVELLDAPVSGGVRGARTGTLVVMVGGAPDAFERCRPMLEVVGSSVVHMGRLGSGYVTKLVNNYMGMTNAIASMEAMVLGVKAGLDPERLLEVVNQGTGASHMTRTLYPYLVFRRSFYPARFSMELAAKDFRLAVDLADELQVPLRVGRAAFEALAEAASGELAEADMSAYITRLEAAAGVEVRA